MEKMKTANRSGEMTVYTVLMIVAALVLVAGVGVVWTANLAQLDLNDKKPDAARKRFEALVERDPKNVQAMVALSQLMARTGAKAEDVTALLKKAQTADPAAIEPLLALAQQQVQIGKPKDAIPLVQQALAQQPENAQLLDALGTHYLRADDKQHQGLTQTAWW